MLPTRIFRNRWHALLFAGVICVLAAEFASDASPPIAAPVQAEATISTQRRTSDPANEATPLASDDTGPSLFASLLAPRDASDAAPRMLPYDTDGDGVPDATAREVR